MTHEPPSHPAPRGEIIAMPCAGDRLATHFGHADRFAFVHCDRRVPSARVRRDAEPPAHAPGVLPRWLADQGAGVVIAGGIGDRARLLLAEAGIACVHGVPDLPLDEVVTRYLTDDLPQGVVACDHPSGGTACRH